MATLKFYLQPQNKKNRFPVMMVYQEKGKKFRFYTRVTIKKENWVKNSFKPISLEDFVNKEKLTVCQSVISEIEKEAIQHDRYLSVEEMALEFRERIKKTDAFNEMGANRKNQQIIATQSQFFTHFDEFVEQSKATKAKGTIRHYEGFKRLLIKYETHSGKPIDFEAINNSFFQKFHHYLINIEKMMNNTIGAQIKELKVFLNYAMRNELTQVKYNFKDFKTIKEDVDIISMNENELFRLYECKTLNKQQDIARDYVCFECFTGLRFSDICRLKNENIKEDFIELRTKKTKDILFVPLNVFAKEILAKYKGIYKDSPLPPPYSNQKVNTYIKEAAKEAKIDELTMVEKFSGSNRVVFTKPKYAFICTHTGRRTFITLSHEKGMNIEMIMKITGIKKWDTLKKYLKVSEKSKLMKMNEFWNRDSMVSNPIN
ncbi:site-specific integrase [Sediminibacterium sp. TEGAF015]|uniref:site-specific integrase n=1 Tax=Sediminibacterium sp. TEGAF015 TaxID=575378 RepID=UPI002232BDEC|nr:site-specific integrase [Sediminibacterium sp. TEGAF015]